MNSLTMKKTFVSIDSGFRLAGTSSSFSIVLATTLENVKRLSLESACIPYTFFDIRDTYHVPLQEAAQPIVAVTIPQKNYSPTQLAAQLAISLTAASLNFDTYTVSYDSQTGGYTISSTGSFQLAWTTDFYTNGNNQNYMYSVLGFSDLSVIRMPDPDTGYATSQVSSGVGMISTDYLMLTIRPAPSNYVTTSNQNAFAMIPVNGNQFDKIYWNSFSSYDQYCEFAGPGTNLRELIVELKYTDSVVVDLNGCQLSLILSYTQYPPNNVY